MAQRNSYSRGAKRHSPYWKDRPRNPGQQAKEEKGSDGGPEPAPDTFSDDKAPVGDGATPSESRKEKKYSNRARLFVGNLPKDMTEKELVEMFRPYGENPQAHIERERNFGFVRMPYRLDAEKAISALNGTECNGRELRIRIAASSCSVKVSNLHPMVSNELLGDAFSQFGEVEHAVVVTDERGKSKGYGIVDFAKKSQAIQALHACSQRFFLLTRSPMPVVVSELIRDNEEGLPDKQLQKNSSYAIERESKPRFATPATPEFDMAARWWAVYDNDKARREELEQQLKDSRMQLQREMEQFNRQDFMQEQTMHLRAQLVHHQEEQARLAEEIRRQEQQLQGFQGGVGGPGFQPPPLPQPLFSVGGPHRVDRSSRADHSKTILPNPPGPPRAGLMPPPFPSPLPSVMGSRYPPP